MITDLYLLDCVLALGIAWRLASHWGWRGMGCSWALAGCEVVVGYLFWPGLAGFSTRVCFCAVVDLMVATGLLLDYTLNAHRPR